MDLVYSLIHKPASKNSNTIKYVLHQLINSSPLNQSDLSPFGRWIQIVPYLTWMVQILPIKYN